MKKCPKLAAFMAVLAIGIALVGTGCPTESSGGETFDIIIAPSDYGSITASPPKAAENDRVTLTIYPDTGYRLKSISVAPVGGGNVTLGGSGNNSGATRTFNMPASNVNVTGEFEPVPKPTFTITNAAEGIANGTVTYAPVQAIYYGGETITITATPNPGYSLGDVTVSHVNDGEPLEGESPFTFTMPENNVTINAVFEAIQFNINISAENAARISNTLAAKATIGTPITLNLIMPPVGSGTEGTDVWETKVTVTGGSPAPVVTIKGLVASFNMPAANVTITIAFTEVPASKLTAYKIDLTEATDSVSLSTVSVYMADGETPIADPDNVYNGLVVVLDVETEDGYHLASIKVETDEATPVEVPLGAISDTQYSFTMPEKNVKVIAEWVPISAVVRVTFAGFNEKTFTLTPDPQSAFIEQTGVTLIFGWSLWVDVSGLAGASGFTWFLDDKLSDAVTNWSEYAPGIGYYPTQQSEVGKHTLTVIVYVGGGPGIGVPYSSTLNVNVSR